MGPFEPIPESPSKGPLGSATIIFTCPRSKAAPMPNLGPLGPMVRPPIKDGQTDRQTDIQFGQGIMLLYLVITRVVNAG